VSSGPTWHLLAGEFPPQFGGIAAYTLRVAEALAGAGEAVHVWALGPRGEAEEWPGVTVHRVGDRWSSAAFARAGAGVDAFPAPRRLLVQYAPNAWGPRGLNFGLARWLAGRLRRGDDVRVMFHELWYFPLPGDRPARRALSAAQRLLARWLVASSTMIYVSIPHWGKLLGRYQAARRRPVAWLPVPSTIPVVDDREGSAEVRQKIARPGQPVVGHFGTYGGRTADLLFGALPEVLDACPASVGLLIGPGGEAFAERLVAARPELHGRLAATGTLTDTDASLHLRACDLLVQPYPGGVTGRRTSVMAALAHGVPVVTTSGDMTEPLWDESEAVATAPEGDAGALAGASAALLGDPDARARLVQAGRRLYERRFAVERTIEILTGSDGTRNGSASVAASEVSAVGGRS
jgi:glycosyltransferase involved in cell wall biosynthesis